MAGGTVREVGEWVLGSDGGAVGGGGGGGGKKDLSRESHQGCSDKHILHNCDVIGGSFKMNCPRVEQFISGVPVLWRSGMIKLPSI